MGPRIDWNNGPRHGQKPATFCPAGWTHGCPGAPGLALPPEGTQGPWWLVGVRSRGRTHGLVQNQSQRGLLIGSTRVGKGQSVVAKEGL